MLLIHFCQNSIKIYCSRNDRILHFNTNYAMIYIFFCEASVLYQVVIVLWRLFLISFFKCSDVIFNIYFFHSLLKQPKRKGVEGLIEIENPNRVSQKSKKVVEVDVNAPKELSRRERYLR